MYRDKRVVVVMPAYNAEQTLLATYDIIMVHPDYQYTPKLIRSELFPKCD